MSFNITYKSLEKLLPCAEGAQINSSIKDHEPSCLSDTRVDVLKEIRSWAKVRGDERCVFWLSGMAGTGKSTIARTIAREHLAQDQLFASFFFTRGGGDVGNASKFFTTIAFQLIRRSTALKRCILKAVDENRDIAKLALTDQWKLLIVEPLTIANEESPQLSLLLVIDALDECEGDRDVRLILQLLAAANKQIPTIQLRVLVTSRPDTSIHLGFRENSGIWHRDLVLNAVPREVVDRDITIYFLEELGDIISSQDEDTIRLLVEKACGLFIWASTACRFIKSGKRFASKRLSSILEKGMFASTPEKELDRIYTRILSDSISGDYQEYEKENLFSDFRSLVGAIVILFKPLSADALASLLHISQHDVKGVLLGLQSVLEIPTSSADPIRLLHPSFRDFLLADERCFEPQLRVNEKHAHRMLTEGCIGVMSSSLRRDICGLQRPGSLLSDATRSQVEHCIRPELQYACLYWIQHLQKSDIPLHGEEQVHQFLRKHLLHWLEALAWLERTSEAILALISLEGQIEADKSPSLHEFVRDAKRVALSNRNILEEAPLQLYCSAIIFAPQDSVVRRTFDHSVPQWIQTKPKVQQYWDAALHTLEGHSDCVTSVAFSPDGKVVASASWDKTVRLWDAATGAKLQKLEGHSDFITSVAFSPDGRVVASASKDNTVSLWDAWTGAVRQTLKGHSDCVTSVTFSPDGKVVASASDDNTVRLWDAATGAARQTLEGHSDWVTSVAFSPDVKVVASASDDKTVRLWDAATGAALQTLEGHSDCVTSVAFAPDGKVVASASWDNTVRLWDAVTGAALQTIEGHSDRVTSAAFSPDGKVVVSASDDKTVRLWDAVTGAACQTLEGHSDCVTSVAFSPDSKVVASASDDNTVRLWDAVTGAACQMLEGHSEYITSVAFSPDGKVVASASDDNTVRLWNAVTGAVRQTLVGHSAWVTLVAFSPDGKVVASASNDNTVMLWDAATGSARQTLKGHSDPVRSVAFSPDGKVVASASWDKTVRLWDAATGAARQTLKGHSDPVRSVAFSPDGMMVASASWDNTVRLWDAATGVALQTLEGHSDPVRSVAFSPDGKVVASASWDKTVRLWDAATGAARQTLHLGIIVNALSFSISAEYLNTDKGMFSLSPRTKSATSTDTSATMSLVKEWIRDNEQSILWLPKEYREAHVAVFGSLVALGQSSGRISFLQFAQGSKTI